MGGDSGAFQGSSPYDILLPAVLEEWLEEDWLWWVGGGGGKKNVNLMVMVKM